MPMPKLGDTSTTKDEKLEQLKADFEILAKALLDSGLDLLNAVRRAESMVELNDAFYKFKETLNEQEKRLSTR